MRKPTNFHPMTQKTLQKLCGECYKLIPTYEKKPDWRFLKINNIQILNIWIFTSYVAMATSRTIRWQCANMSRKFNQNKEPIYCILSKNTTWNYQILYAVAESAFTAETPVLFLTMFGCHLNCCSASHSPNLLCWLLILKAAHRLGWLL